jgi:hypothetical protein
MQQAEFSLKPLSIQAFTKIVWGLFAAYFLIEILLIPYCMLAYDEYWFAQHILQYTQHIPYRDFLPYKTTLGYYILTLPMWFFHDLFKPVFLIKDEIALINSLILGGAAIYSGRFFNLKAILLTLLVIISSQFFLFYSVDLRTDMLASWLGLIAALFILREKNSWAGLFVGLSFLISQKAAWFFIAINFAYLLTWLISYTKNCSTSLLSIKLRSIVIFNVCFLFCLTLYVLFWSFISSPAVVFHSLFYEAYTQAKITWYSQVYRVYWQMILANGPLFIVLLPLTWLGLFVSPLSSQRVFIISFSTALMGLLISYQQAFPYNMVFAVPACFLIYADFFTWLSNLSSKNSDLRIKQRFLFWFLASWAIGVISLFIIQEVTSAYFLILAIPFCLFLFIKNHQTVYAHLMLLAIFFLGIFYPLLRVMEFTSTFNSGYQKFTLALTDELIKNEGGYIAGTPLLYFKRQAIPGLENLISPAIAYLYYPSKKLLPILIPSLYLIPTTQTDILANLKTTPVKLYVNNNRMMNLPPAILSYLHSEFTHFWASVYIYSPEIPLNQKQFIVKFNGKYRVLATNKARILIDNKKIQPNSFITLTKGSHRSLTSETYRLQLVPTHLEQKLPLEYQRDAWQATGKL